jgi:hypothetical protein
MADAPDHFLQGWTEKGSPASQQRGSKVQGCCCQRTRQPTEMLFRRRQRIRQKPEADAVAPIAEPDRGQP